MQSSYKVLLTGHLTTETSHVVSQTLLLSVSLNAVHILLKSEREREKKRGREREVFLAARFSPPLQRHITAPSFCLETKPGCQIDEIDETVPGCQKITYTPLMKKPHV